MDDRERFLIAQEDNGSFLRVYIPGKRPNNWPTHSIKWTGREHQAPYDEWRREASRLHAFYKKKGLLNDLPERQIPGYSHSYAYAFHPRAIAEITPDPKDQICIRNDVAYNMKHMLWFPLRELLREKIKQYAYIQLEIPKFPLILTEEMCQAWYENNQKSIKFFERLAQTSQDTHIETISSDREITLKITNHPFVSRPVQRIRILPQPTPSVTTLTEDQLRLLHLRVLSRNSNMLKGLTDIERKQLRRGNNAALTASYPLHWIHWLSLSGSMTEQNAMVISSEIAKSYQFSVRYPFEQYWRRNRSFFEKQGLPVFVELPIPTNDYRSRPIAHTITHHPSRRHLNHMTNRALQDYYLEKE